MDMNDIFHLRPDVSLLFLLKNPYKNFLSP